MIRRPTVLAGALVAAVSLSASLSGCATFDRADAVAVVDGHELSRDQLAQLTDHDGSGATVRDAITRWVQTQLLGGDATGATSSAELQTAFEKALTTLAAGHLDEGRALYEKGLTSPYLCLGVIPLGTADDAAAVIDAYGKGTTWADLATQYSTAPDLASSGGVLKDANGAECIEPSGLNAELVASLQSAGAAVGTPVAITFNNQTLVMLLRPFDELTDQSKTGLALPAAQGDATALFDAADVHIDSQYGRWTGGQVQPLGNG